MLLCRGDAESALAAVRPAGAVVSPGIVALHERTQGCVSEERSGATKESADGPASPNSSSPVRRPRPRRSRADGGSDGRREQTQARGRRRTRGAPERRLRRDDQSRGSCSRLRGPPRRRFPLNDTGGVVVAGLGPIRPSMTSREALRARSRLRCRGSGLVVPPPSVDFPGSTSARVRLAAKGVPSALSASPRVVEGFLPRSATSFRRHDRRDDRRHDRRDDRRRTGARSAARNVGMHRPPGA
jgi:hypothetical protein